MGSWREAYEKWQGRDDPTIAGDVEAYEAGYRAGLEAARAVECADCADGVPLCEDDRFRLAIRALLEET